jgi:FkbM family methyltransferase
VKSSPITDPLAWLVEASTGCICDQSLDELFALGLEEEMGSCRGGGIVETCWGLRFYVPCGYSEHAWANIVHIACLDDYGLLSHPPRPGARVVDAGAGFGYFAAAALQLGAGSVVLVEPSPRARRIAARVLQALGLAERVRLVAAALAPRPGRLRLYEADNIVNSSLLPGYPSSRGAEIAGVVEVEAVTPARLLDEAGLGAVEVFKLDIEGLEAQVVEAMEEEGLLDGPLGCLIVEAHSETGADTVEETLLRHGYRVVHRRWDYGFQQYFLHACRG